MGNNRELYKKLSMPQLKYIFKGVFEIVEKYNSLPQEEVDWDTLTAEVIEFGEKKTRNDRYAVRLILETLDYLQYSKMNEKKALEESQMPVM